MPGDRRWAIRNGSQDVAADGSWTQCQALVRMTREEGLPLYRIRKNNNGELCLQHPSGDEIQVEERLENKPVLKQWFDHPEAGFSQARASVGYWDHPDAMISVINLTTVKALSQVAGQIR